MLPLPISDPALAELFDGALRDQPLSVDDFARLLASSDVHAVRALADQRRRRAHGDATTTVRSVPTRVFVAQLDAAALHALAATQPAAVLVCDPAHERTALEYLLKPLREQITRTFRER